MNLSTIIDNPDKAVSTKNILKENGLATLIKIRKGAVLSKHQSKTNALLVLLSGKAQYKESDRKIELSAPHDFVSIPEKITHEVFAEEESLLLLIH